MAYETSFHHHKDDVKTKVTKFGSKQLFQVGEDTKSATENAQAQTYDCDRTIDNDRGALVLLFTYDYNDYKMGTKPFFYICVGLTLSLPLFYIDLAVVEFFARGRTTTELAGEGLVSLFSLCVDMPCCSHVEWEHLRFLVSRRLLF